MLELTFKQTTSELLVRAAASALFGTLARRGAKLVSISDLAEHPQYGFTASAAKEPVGPKFVRITDLQDGKIDWDTVPFCECAEPDKYLLRDDDLLFARTGATTGKTHLVKDAERAVFASYLIRLRPKPGVLAAYLHAFFQSDTYWTQISEEKEGSAQPNVNGEKLAALQIPRVEPKLQNAIAEFLRCVRSRQDGEKVNLPELPPPLAEQRLVVARIEELAAQINEARPLRHQAAEEAGALISSAVTNLCFQDAETSSFGDFLVEAKNGIYKPPMFWGQGLPCLRMYNIEGPALNQNRLQLLDVTHEELQTYGCVEGDLVFNRVNSAELVGKTGIVPHGFPRSTYESKNMRLRVDVSRIDPKFAAHILNSQTVRKYYLSALKQQCGMATLNQGHVRSIPFPKVELPEQRRIVAELDALQSEVDALKRLQAETAAELDALLPAILDRAFKGEL